MGAGPDCVSGDHVLHEEVLRSERGLGLATEALRERSTIANVTKEPRSGARAREEAKTPGLPAEIARSQSGPFVAHGNKLPGLAVLSKGGG